MKAMTVFKKNQRTQELDDEIPKGRHKNLIDYDSQKKLT